MSKEFIPPVTVKRTDWGTVYKINGEEKDGEKLPPEKAADILQRFKHDQELFSSIGRREVKPKPQ